MGRGMHCLYLAAKMTVSCIRLILGMSGTQDPALLCFTTAWAYISFKPHGGGKPVLFSTAEWLLAVYH